MAQSDASIDAQLELKKRARRRLVGAAALALLAAIVLPMVMDHEPRPVNPDIQVRIPSQDAGGFSSRILPSKPAATPLPPLAAGDGTRPPAVDPKPQAKPEALPKPTAPAKADEPATAKPAEKPATKAPNTETKPEPKSEDAPAAEQWVVQLGAYKEAGNVKLLLSKLKEMGVPAYTEKFEAPQGPRTRVRAGPFASKEAAEKAKAKARIVGVDGSVAPK